MDFNNTTLLSQLEKDFGWRIDYVTLWTYVKKGFIKPSSFMHNGKRIVPIYYNKDYLKISKRLRRLADIGKIRIKGYKKNEKK